MSRTAMMITPSLQEVELAAAKIGLSNREAQKFYFFYESKGWKVGKQRMVSMNGALSGWKIRCQERQEQQPNGANGSPKKHWAERELEAIDRSISEQ